MRSRRLVMLMIGRTMESDDYFLINLSVIFFFFFFNDTATTEIYTLSLHDALPISPDVVAAGETLHRIARQRPRDERHELQDRKSTRLNSSHSSISYAVFCLKKKTSNR